MKLIFAALLSVVLFGCAVPAPTFTKFASDSAGLAAQRAEASDMRLKLQALHEQRRLASLENEIAQLEREIAELQAKLEALESDIAVREAQLTTVPGLNPSRGASSAGPVYTGPRGGRYTISPSGKKSYIRRK